MPNGFRGSHAATYLYMIYELHSQAAYAASETAPGAPAGPRVKPLPFPPSAAHGGSHATGHGSSANIVSEQNEYSTFAKSVMEADERAGQTIHDSSGTVQGMTGTTFVLPSATPRIANITAGVNTALSLFRSSTEEKATSARGFAGEIVGVG